MPHAECEPAAPATLADPVKFIHREIHDCFAKLRARARVLARTRADADDLVQATCLRALENPHRLRHDTNSYAWLLRIMHNLNIDRVRSICRERILDVAGELPAPALEPCPIWRTIGEDEVSRAVATLLPKYRWVWYLATVRRLPQDQIAARLGISHRTVASRLFRARAALRRLLTGRSTPNNGSRELERQWRKSEVDASSPLTSAMDGTWPGKDDFGQSTHPSGRSHPRRSHAGRVFPPRDNGPNVAIHPSSP
jgi:RNA polymerase sigma-70 factor (ECF subfamily)